MTNGPGHGASARSRCEGAINQTLEYLSSARIAERGARAVGQGPTTGKWLLTGRRSQVPLILGQ
jgi:hypothetical protein